MAIYMQSLKEEVKGEGGSFREKKKSTEDFLSTCLYLAEFHSNFFPPSSFSPIFQFYTCLPPSPAEYYSASMTECL